MTDISTGEKVALCLSGGGFRAAIFHLGALTRLNELGVLSQVDTFSTVSGGSVLSGHLAALLSKGDISWGKPGEVIADWDAKVVSTFLPLVRRDIRTWPVLRGLIPGVINSEQLAGIYNKFYQGSDVNPIKLTEIPVLPQFIFCSTNLFHGTGWESTCLLSDSGKKKAEVGDYKTGKRDGSDWTLGYAVASSSCFPPVFSAMKPKLSEKVNSEVREYTRLSDGGLYDNLGLEPVWKTMPRILVSDGGASLESEHETGVKRLLRYGSVALEQVGSLRKRWLMARYRGECKPLAGAYWGIGSAVKGYKLENEAYGFDKTLTEGMIAAMRTDFDPFSPNEIAILMKHGYEIADAAIHKWELELKAIECERRKWGAGWNDIGNDKVNSTLIAAEGRKFVRWPFLTKRHKRNDLIGELDPQTLLPPST